MLRKKSIQRQLRGLDLICMVTTRPPKTIVKPTALGPVANTDAKLLIYGLFQKGRVLAQDGVPLNDSTDPFGGAVNLESLPLNGIERIEIARGPMSFYQGSAALAGVINLVSERSERDETVARAEIEAGNGSAFRTAASFSDGFTGGDYFAAVQWEKEAGRVAEDRFQQLHLLGNLNLNLGESAGLSLGTRVASWESDDYPEASGGPLLGSGEVRQSEHEEMSLRADLRLDEPARRRHKLSASLYRHDLDRQSPGVGVFVPSSMERTRYTRARAEWAAALFTTRRRSLNVGDDSSGQQT